MYSAAASYSSFFIFNLTEKVSSNVWFTLCTQFLPALNPDNHSINNIGALPYLGMIRHQPFEYFTSAFISVKFDDVVVVIVLFVCCLLCVEDAHPPVLVYSA